MKPARTRPIHALLATAVLTLLVVPFAVPGGADGATSVKRQLERLERRVIRLERRGTAPRGPAGGDLTGSYPNPLVGAGAVGGDELLDGSVGSKDIGVGAVDSPRIEDASVSSSDIGFGAVGDPQIEAGAVRGSELGNAHAVISEGVFVAPGTTKEVVVTCPPGERLLAGGPEWGFDRDGTAVISSSPSFTGGANLTWVVQGRVDSGELGNTLFADALCLRI